MPLLNTWITFYGVESELARIRIKLEPHDAGIARVVLGIGPSRQVYYTCI